MKDSMDSISPLLLMPMQHVSSSYCNGTIVAGGDVFAFVWSLSAGTRNGDISFARESVKHIAESPSPSGVPKLIEKRMFRFLL